MSRRQPTPFTELNAVLADLTDATRAILGETFVGAYLQGSFALGAADLTSDCDFIVAVTRPPGGAREAALRRLHDEIPTRPGHWNRHLEGSYADVATLRTVDGVGSPWLYVDHGSRDAVRDPHCNTVMTRWILHHHGVRLAGPPVASLVDDPPAEAMRAAMRAALPRFMADLESWAPFDVAWTQWYAVATYCRMLHTLYTARVTSKPGALRWARETLDARWRPLLTQVLEDRAAGLPWSDPPRPGSLAATRAFGRYAETLARGA